MLDREHRVTTILATLCLILGPLVNAERVTPESLSLAA